MEKSWKKLRMVTRNSSGENTDDVIQILKDFMKAVKVDQNDLGVLSIKMSRFTEVSREGETEFRL